MKSTNKESLVRRVNDRLCEGESVILADGFEDAFIGIGRQFGKPYAVYSREKCINMLIEDGCSHAEAEEYFSFNTEGAWFGENTPIFVETI